LILSQHHVIDEVLGGSGKDKTCSTIDKHQNESGQEKSLPGPYQFAEIPINVGRL
jgi:hypothetical protein